MVYSYIPNTLKMVYKPQLDYSLNFAGSKAKNFDPIDHTDTGDAILENLLCSIRNIRKNIG